MNPTDGRAAATPSDPDEARRVQERRGRGQGPPTDGEILDRAERQGGVLGERPIVTDLAPNLTLTDRGQTTGPHIGIPLAHVEAILRMEDGAPDGDVRDLAHLTDEDKDRVHETFKEMRAFVAAEGTP